MATTKTKMYAIKAYGKTFSFRSKEKYRKYLFDWMVGTEGSEQQRATDALLALEEGYPVTDTDTGKLFVSWDQFTSVNEPLKVEVIK